MFLFDNMLQLKFFSDQFFFWIKLIQFETIGTKGEFCNSLRYAKIKINFETESHLVFFAQVQLL